MELVNKIANLAFGAFYNESLDRVVVHFFNKDENKPDVVAYLLPNLAWDVREIVDEISELDPMEQDGFLGENITITHERLGIYSKGSDFDVFMRSAIEGMSNQEELNTIDSRVLDILDSDSYLRIKN